MTGLDDLPGAVCAFCGDCIEGKRVCAVYCSRDCGNRWRRKLRAVAARAAKASNTCIFCGAAIPTDRRADTLFCGKACSDRVSWHRTQGKRLAEARMGRACVTCGGPIPDNLRMGTKFCGKVCRETSNTQQLRERRRARRKG